MDCTFNAPDPECPGPRPDLIDCVGCGSPVVIKPVNLLTPPSSDGEQSIPPPPQGGFWDHFEGVVNGLLDSGTIWDPCDAWPEDCHQGWTFTDPNTQAYQDGFNSVSQPPTYTAPDGSVHPIDDSPVFLPFGGGRFGRSAEGHPPRGGAGLGPDWAPLDIKNPACWNGCEELAIGI
jgi:hypothetical protein